MNKAEVLNKVNAVINAPSCCPELKAVAEEYLASQGTEKEAEAAKALIAELEVDVQPIDAVINFFGTPLAKEKFGAEMAGNILAHAKEVKAGGGVYCDCAACAPGKEILDNREVIL